MSSDALRGVVSHGRDPNRRASAARAGATARARCRRPPRSRRPPRRSLRGAACADICAKQSWFGAAVLRRGGSASRKWIVRSIVGAAAGAPVAMNGGGISASLKKASESASIGRGSARPIQAPSSIGRRSPVNGRPWKRGCMTRCSRERRRAELARGARPAFDVRPLDVGHRQVVDLRRRSRAPRRPPSTSAISRPSCSIRAESVLSERPARSITRADHDRARLGRAGVVDRQRARRALRVVDGLDQRAQQHRRQVAAVRAAPGAPAVGDGRVEHGRLVAVLAQRDGGVALERARRSAARRRRRAQPRTSRL